MTNQKNELTNSETRMMKSYIEGLIHHNKVNGETKLVGLKLYNRSQINSFLQNTLKSVERGYLTSNQIHKVFNHQNLIFKYEDMIFRGKQIPTPGDDIIVKLWKKITDNF